MDVAIQIINYNTLPYLTWCTADVIRDLCQCDLDYEINILDNASNDNLSDFRRQHANNRVRVFSSEKNLGFGAGHNFLSNHTDAPFLLILNPDVRLIQSQSISGLYHAVRKASDIKVVGPILVTEEGEVQEWDHGELNGVLARIALDAGSSYWVERRTSVDVAWVSGACLMVEKAAFQLVDGFDPKFFLYKEEEDLCWRLRKCGFRIRYEPNIKVMHHGSVVANKSKYMQESNRYFFTKNIAVRKGHIMSLFMYRIIRRFGFYN